jgi:hypothetical protein
LKKVVEGETLYASRVLSPAAASANACKPIVMGVDG